MAHIATGKINWEDKANYYNFLDDDEDETEAKAATTAEATEGEPPKKKFRDQTIWECLLYDLGESLSPKVMDLICRAKENHNFAQEWIKQNPEYFQTSDSEWLDSEFDETNQQQ
jgi:hypothetical protein